MTDTDTVTPAAPVTLPVRALVTHHHMGDQTVHQYLVEVLLEMEQEGVVDGFEFLAASRTEWMEVGVFSVDLHGLVQPTWTWEYAKNAVEAYLTGLFHDEMLVQGLYGLG